MSFQLVGIVFKTFTSHSGGIYLNWCLTNYLTLSVQTSVRAYKHNQVFSAL